MAKLEDLQKIKNLKTVLIIFGATGNLAQDRIFPALFKLYKSNLLPTQFKILACARTSHSHREFRKITEDSIGQKDREKIPDFFQKIDYLSLDIAENLNLGTLEQKINTFEKNGDKNSCVRRIFYMAISPIILQGAIENLAKNNLHTGCQNHHPPAGGPRIIIEKPFGYDRASAQNLAKTLTSYFSEKQIFRIDHYLGKETVQNIFAFRFANDLFEHIWNKEHIDHIQITTAEHIGVEKRGEFYDKTGALRDIVQNHQLQLLALTTMDEPEKFQAAEIKKRKLEIFSSISKISPEEIIKSTVRGQYDGFLQEEKINPKSQTETYALVKLFIENKRWQGVPFYLRTGKKLTGKVTSIIIQFKEKGHKLLENFWETPMPNHIILQIQPNEGIGIRLVAKKPGLTNQLEPVDMEFCYKTSFDVPQPEAYERLLLDVILGDQSLFISQEEVEKSWRIIDPIRKVWDAGKPPLATYKPGSWGPKEADELIEADGHQWLQPFLTICKI